MIEMILYPSSYKSFKDADEAYIENYPHERYPYYAKQSFFSLFPNHAIQVLKAQIGTQKDSVWNELALSEKRVKKALSDEQANFYSNLKVDRSNSNILPLNPRNNPEYQKSYQKWKTSKLFSSYPDPKKFIDFEAMLEPEKFPNPEAHFSISAFHKILHVRFLQRRLRYIKKQEFDESLEEFLILALAECDWTPDDFRDLENAEKERLVETAKRKRNSLETTAKPEMQEDTIQKDVMQKLRRIKWSGTYPQFKTLFELLHKAELISKKDAWEYSYHFEAHFDKADDPEGEAFHPKPSTIRNAATRPIMKDQEDELQEIVKKVKKSM